jgi:hypothetical protein
MALDVLLYREAQNMNPLNWPGKSIEWFAVVTNLQEFFKPWCVAHTMDGMDAGTG